ncbi:MAG: hypothetical protein ACYS47_20950, partial [Planctomycetota bacterium]
RFLRAYLGGRLGPPARRWIVALNAARRKYEVWELPRLEDTAPVPAAETPPIAGDRDSASRAAS